MLGFTELWECLHDDPSPTPNLDSTRAREQPELGPSLRGTENKGLDPCNSGGFSLIWTALGLAPPPQCDFGLAGGGGGGVWEFFVFADDRD